MRAMTGAPYFSMEQCLRCGAIAVVVQRSCHLCGWCFYDLSLVLVRDESAEDSDGSRTADKPSAPARGVVEA